MSEPNEIELSPKAQEAMRWIMCEAPDSMLVKEVRAYVAAHWGEETNKELEAWSKR